jgi:hypothetical protein
MVYKLFSDRTIMLPLWIETLCLLTAGLVRVTAQPTTLLSAVKTGNDADAIIELRNELSQLRLVMLDMAGALSGADKPSLASSTEGNK